MSSMFDPTASAAAPRGASLHAPTWTRTAATVVCAVLCGLSLLGTARDARAADAVATIDNDTNNIAAAVRHTAGEVQSTIARERRYPKDKRFVEATLAYERGNYAVAAVLFVDLIYKPEFQRTRDYYGSLYMLGDALYRMRNFRAARRYLDLVVRKQGGKHFEDALQSLVEIAIRRRAFDEVSQYATFLGSVPPGARRAELLYQFGRSYLAGQRFEDARKYLSQVSVGEKPWAAARFYLGAIYTRDNKLDDALREFRDILQAGDSRDPKQRPPQLVLDYANLGAARIYLQQKKYEDAARFYQKVDRASPVFEEALFELAATWVALQKPRKALEALDLLLISTTDDSSSVEAAVLRGRINLMLKEYDQADGAYKDVVDRYSAINGEMTRFARSSELLEQFFTWLLHRGGNDYSVVRPVSERVAKFIEKDPDMARVVELFDEMAAEKRDVRESAKLAETLDAALKSNTRLEMFPALRDKWLSLLENENQLVQLGQRTVQLLGETTKDDIGASEKGRFAAMLAENKRLYDAFQRIPATARAYSQRQSRVDNQLNELAAQTSLLRAQLAALRDELMATEKMLNERIFGAEAVVLSKEKEAEIRAGLEQEKHELRRISRMLDDLSGDVEIDATRFGSGDAVSVDESKVRGLLLANQRALQSAYNEVLRRTGKNARDVATLQVVRSRIDQTLLDIASTFRVIDGRVQERTSEMVKVLQQEQGNIAEYKITVSKYEEESRSLARDIGYTLIRRAQNRLADIVLEADLGLVDVAWQRKQDKASKIRDLQGERNEKVRKLQGVLESLIEDGDDEEGAE